MRRRRDVLWRIAPGFLAVSRPGQDVTVIRGAAAHLWELAVDEVSIEEIAATLADFFGAGPDRVMTEVKPIIEDLIEKRLLEDSDGD